MHVTLATCPCVAHIQVAPSEKHVFVMFSNPPHTKGCVSFEHSVPTHSISIAWGWDCCLAGRQAPCQVAIQTSPKSVFAFETAGAYFERVGRMNLALGKIN